MQHFDAIKAPTAPKKHHQTMKNCQDEDSVDDIECAIPFIKEPDDSWVVHAERVRSLAESTRKMAVWLVTAISLLLCVIFFFVCPKCMFGVLLLSACLCPWIHAMNAPLWLAIVLLTVSGWSLTTGFLSVTWSMH